MLARRFKKKKAVEGTVLIKNRGRESVLLRMWQNIFSSRPFYLIRRTLGWLRRGFGTHSRFSEPTVSCAVEVEVAFRQSLLCVCEEKRVVVGPISFG